MSEKQVVFISCGQYTPAEKRVGGDVQDLVRALTPYTPYFAEYQSSLEGLSQNILGALYRAVGFIAIMHHRGQIQGDAQRASVWIEQEIAIAAFLRQVLELPIEVRAYKQRGIAMEGMRSQLGLRPFEFSDNGEILKDLRTILPTWNLPPPQVVGNAYIDLRAREIRSYIGQAVTVEVIGRTFAGVPRATDYVQGHDCQIVDCTALYVKLVDMASGTNATAPLARIDIATDEKHNGRPKLVIDWR